MTNEYYLIQTYLIFLVFLEINFQKLLDDSKG